MKKAEKIIGTIAICSLVLKLFLIPGSAVLSTFTWVILSLMYGMFGFALFNNIRFSNIFKEISYQGVTTWRVIGGIVTGYFLMSITCGILFKSQLWNGGELLLLIGLFWLFVIVVVGGLKYIKTRSEYYLNIFKRVTIFGGLGIVLLATPATQIIAIQYRNYPNFVEVYKQALAEPHNVELWEKLQKGRQQIDFTGKDIE